MSQPPPQLPQYGIEHLYLFDFYGSRQQYRDRTGTEPPPYDPAKNVKRWVDPNPRSASRTVTYSRVLARDERNQPVADGQGRPLVEPLSMEKAFASVVNIPPDTHTGTSDTGVALYEYDCPLRELQPEEELVFAQMGTVVVRNGKLWQEHVENQSGAFLPRDRELLEGIAAKLGVERDH